MKRTELGKLVFVVGRLHVEGFEELGALFHLVRFCLVSHDQRQPVHDAIHTHQQRRLRNELKTNAIDDVIAQSRL